MIEDGMREWKGNIFSGADLLGWGLGCYAEASVHIMAGSTLTTMGQPLKESLYLQPFKVRLIGVCRLGDPESSIVLWGLLLEIPGSVHSRKMNPSKTQRSHWILPVHTASSEPQWRIFSVGPLREVYAPTPHPCLDPRREGSKDGTHFSFLGFSR